MEKEKNTYSMSTGIHREGYGLRAATGDTTACVFDTEATDRIMGLRQAVEPVTAAMLNEAARRQQIEDFPPCHGPAGETQKAGIVQ